MKRDDDYQVRRQSVANLSDKELEQRFWQLAEQIVDPLLKLGYENTSPAIERSVLLRMGFSSIEAKAIADGCVEHNLLGTARATWYTGWLRPRKWTISTRARLFAKASFGMKPRRSFNGR